MGSGQWRFSKWTLLAGLVWLVLSLWENKWKPTPELGKDALSIVVFAQLPTAVRRTGARADD